MNWKYLLLFGFCIVFGYVAFTAVQFYLSGYPFTIESFLAFTVAGTLGLISQITVFIQDKWQLVLSVVGAIVTAGAGLYRLVSTRIANMRQSYETKVENVQTQATQQYIIMEDKITQQGIRIGELEAQVQDQAKLEGKITQLETDLTKKEAEVQKLIADRNAQDQAYKDILKPCKYCNAKILVWMNECPYCHKLQVIA